MTATSSPLYEKALAELRSDTSRDARTLRLVERAASFIESDVDRPSAEKDTLKAALALYIPAQYEDGFDPAAIEAGYGTATADMVVAAVMYPPGASLATVADTDIAQMSMALASAIMVVDADDLRIELKWASEEELLETRAEHAAMKSNPAFTAAPRLLQRAIDAFEDLVPRTAIDAGRDFGKIGVPRTPKGPSKLPPISAPKPPVKPSKPLRPIRAPRPPK